MKNSQQGFTLVEIMIAIAILAILAIGAFVAINPLELTRRANDSTTQQTARALVEAVNRYNVDNPTSPFPLITGASPLATSYLPFPTLLVTGGFIKNETLSNDSMDKIRLSNIAGSSTIKACFAPESARFRTTLGAVWCAE